MWSRCRCVSRRSISCERLAGELEPELADPRARVEDDDGPSALLTSRHVVFPPYRTVVPPGVASEPRHPQILAFIAVEP